MKQDATTFDSLTPEMRGLRQRAHDICRNFQRSPSKGNLKKLRQLFSACGDEVFIEPGFMCDYGEFIELGSRVYFNHNCLLLDGGHIRIGDDTLVGPGVQILTINHPVNPEQRLKRENLAQDVTIGDNVWIGAGAIILPGVNIGKDAVVAAGSLVTRDVPDATLVAGTPAMVKKSIVD